MINDCINYMCTMFPNISGLEIALIALLVLAMITVGCVIRTMLYVLDCQDEIVAEDDSKMTVLEQMKSAAR